jgi:hypothetical protein
VNAGGGDFDLGRLVLVDGPTTARLRGRAARRRREQFIQVPMEWSERLKAARLISSYRLAHFLLFRHWQSGGKPFPVSNVAPGLEQKEKWRGLRELERLGLIRVENRQRRAPMVTVLWTQSKDLEA